MWTYVYLEYERFLNPHYENDNRIIDQIPMTSHFCLSEWRSFFYKWSEFGQDAGSFKKEKSNGIEENYESAQKVQPLEPYRVGVITQVKQKRKELTDLINNQNELLHQLDIQMVALEPQLPTSAQHINIQIINEAINSEQRLTSSNDAENVTYSNMTAESLSNR